MALSRVRACAAPLGNTLHGPSSEIESNDSPFTVEDLGTILESSAVGSGLTNGGLWQQLKSNRYTDTVRILSRWSVYVKTCFVGQLQLGKANACTSTFVKRVTHVDRKYLKGFKCRTRYWGPHGICELE